MHANSSASRRVFSAWLLAAASVGPLAVVGQASGGQPSEEIILGRIRGAQHSSEAETSLGPLRMAGETDVVFQRVLAGRQRGQAGGVEEIGKLWTDHHLVLRRTDGVLLPAQWDAAPAAHGTPSLVWHDPQWPPPGGVYELILRKGGPSLALNIVHADGRHVELQDDGHPLLRYNYGVVRQFAEREGPYDRACYVHPIWGPSGDIVTGDFSAEHIHQRGLFTAWVKARFGDIETDFWGLGASRGRMLAGEAPPSLAVGPTFARLKFSNRGVVDGQTVLLEHVELTAYAAPLAGGRLFDFQVTHRPAGDYAMELPSVYYGGTSFRGPAGWLKESSRDVQRAIARGVSFADAQWLPATSSLDVQTSEGGDRVGGDRTRVRWVDYTGPLESGWGGVSMYDHPSNLRYPTPIRIHPELPYFSWAVVQTEPLKVSAGEVLRLSYRVWVHDGHPDAAINERIAAGFAAPPVFRWEPL